ncbi:MAG: sulfotransferase domain-containing protein [Pseudomonadota bacterium]
MKPALHIVGCPRSGTTLLAEMIHACHAGILYPRHEESILDVLPDQDRIRLSKKPNDHRWVKPVLDANRSLYVLAMVRDPRAVIASRHAARPGMYFCNFPVWKKSVDTIRELGSHNRVMVIRYEDLVRDPGCVQEKLEGFAAFLKRIHDFQEYHRVSEPSREALDAMNGVRPLDESRLDGWREHLPRIKQQVLRFPALSEELVRLGYESDNGWSALLDGVSAKQYPCRYDDDANRFRQMEQRVRKRLATAACVRRLRRLGS